MNGHPGLVGMFFLSLPKHGILMISRESRKTKAFVLPLPQPCRLTSLPAEKYFYIRFFSLPQNFNKIKIFFIFIKNNITFNK
ncbi:hypothetical protein NIASO_18580 [Niabella soli DSM 19437]|uniref:Uncharacterized protein n=1 Tax=Niabella soli DSM 19437 TaxID=929713 RepID=W0F9E7_9BACT|nr:hypothetical protein NIASO_18580 [Niabella soli DSM 19437]